MNIYGWYDENNKWMNVLNKSDSESSFGDLSLDISIEFIVWNSLSSKSSDGMDDFNKLLCAVSILELLINILKVMDVEFSLSLNIQKGEISSASFLVEWTSLSKSISTILAVNYLRNCSKSRACPWVESWTYCNNLNTNSYLVSSPRVDAVIRTYLMSALLCLGSA